jgi:hypothetical protein
VKENTPGAGKIVKEIKKKKKQFKELSENPTVHFLKRIFKEKKVRIKDN